MLKAPAGIYREEKRPGWVNIVDWERREPSARICVAVQVIQYLRAVNGIVQICFLVKMSAWAFNVSNSFLTAWRRSPFYVVDLGTKAAFCSCSMFPFCWKPSELLARRADMHIQWEEWDTKGLGWSQSCPPPAWPSGGGCSLSLPVPRWDVWPTYNSFFERRFNWMAPEGDRAA